MCVVFVSLVSCFCVVVLLSRLIVMCLIVLVLWLFLCDILMID